MKQHTQAHSLNRKWNEAHSELFASFAKELIYVCPLFLPCTRERRHSPTLCTILIVVRCSLRSVCKMVYMQNGSAKTRLFVQVLRIFLFLFLLVSSL